MLLLVLFFAAHFFIEGTASETKAFVCSDSSEIAMENVCDGKKDCQDGSDETHTLCFHVICPENMIRCSYGACIRKDSRCDGKSDCFDNSDENQCGKRAGSCETHQFRCSSGECVPGNAVCNGTFECSDKSEESEDICQTFSCPEHTYRCKFGGCIRVSALCNGHKDCVDGSDESDVVCKQVKCTSKDCKSDAIACPPIASSRLSVTCKEHSGPSKGVVPCNKPVPVGTVAEYECKDYYVPASSTDVNNTKATCQIDGTWNREILKCKPECGRMESDVTALVVHGWTTKAGQWPWHATMYALEAGNWTYWCGGSLISERIVLTAAHCVWKMDVDELQIGLGKFYSDYHKRQDFTQILNVKEIIVQPLYQDISGNFGSDLAIIVLSEAAQLSEFVRPVCVDWKSEHIKTHLKEYNVGMIVGMGIIENDVFAKNLKATSLPVVSDAKCLDKQSHDFKKYITYTSFCAGFQNGTGVCNGDSGGGLIFPESKGENVWYLQGIVSISPRRHGTSFCDPKYYTVFTKVGKYVDWLQEVLYESRADLLQEEPVQNDVTY